MFFSSAKLVAVLFLLMPLLQLLGLITTADFEDSSLWFRFFFPFFCPSFSVDLYLTYIKLRVFNRKSVTDSESQSLLPGTSFSSSISQLAVSRVFRQNNLDSLILDQSSAGDLHSQALSDLTLKNIHGTIRAPPRNEGSAEGKSSVRHNDIYKATLTGDGILITSKGQLRDGSPYHDQQQAAGAPRSSTGTGTSSASLQSMQSVQSNNTFLETASLVSCVTCLSDNDRGASASGYSTGDGGLLANTVIPYGRVLNARYFEGSASVSGNSLVGADVKQQPLADDDSYPGVEPPSKDRHSHPHSHSHSHSLVEIVLAKPRRHDIVPKKLLLSMRTMLPSGTDIVEEILRRSYKNTKRERAVLVIINPYGGKKNAKKLFMTKCKPILLASQCSVDMAYTKYAGHAADIARELDIDKYDTIACASGDGIPYEVINGLFQRPDRAEAFNRLAVTQLPCGSGNAMSVSCHWTSNPSYAALCLVKSVESRIDLMCCSQASYLSKGPRLSFLSQTYGVIAESDINTEFIRWMGPARFELGVAFNVLQRKKYPCDIYVKYAAKSKNELKVHYLAHKAKCAPRPEQDSSNDHDHDNDNENYNDHDDGHDHDHDTNDTIDTIDNENDLQNPVTEKDFKLKYPLDGGLPPDWEKVDSTITDNLGIFYTGKMPYIAADTKFFPAALPSDGAMDMVITDARTPVTRMAPILLGLDRGSHVLQPEVMHSKIIAYKLIPKIANSLFSVDGEKFPLEPLQVEVLPRICKTLLRNGCYVDTEFESM